MITIDTRPQMRRIMRFALVVGVAGAVLCVLGAFIDSSRLFESYLFAYIFWSNLALGGLVLVALYHVVGGRWGLAIRRVLEAAAMTLPLMLVLFVPLLFGLRALYEWTRPEVMASDAVLQAKADYLNVPFFLGRTAIYFVIWVGLALMLRRWSLRQDQTGDARLTRRMALLSRVGLILLVLSITFAAYDWVMSLEPHWYSSVFGLLFLVGQAMAAMALAIVVVAWLSRRRLLADVAQPELFNDLGNLLLAFLMLWAYMNLSQYLTIWAGNLPEEATWYVHRSAGGWEWLIRCVLVFQFAGPLLVLLSRRAKRNLRALTILSITILAVHVVEIYWRVLPSFDQTVSLSWLDVAAFLGIGGLWVALFAWQLGRAPLVPLHDPLSPQRAPAEEAAYG